MKHEAAINALRSRMDAMRGNLTDAEERSARYEKSLSEQRANRKIFENEICEMRAAIQALGGEA